MNKLFSVIKHNIFNRNDKLKISIKVRFVQFKASTFFIQCFSLVATALADFILTLRSNSITQTKLLRSTFLVFVKCFQVDI